MLLSLCDQLYRLLVARSSTGRWKVCSSCSHHCHHQPIDNKPTELLVYDFFILFFRYMSGIATDCPGMSYIPYLRSSHSPSPSVKELKLNAWWSSTPFWWGSRQHCAKDIHDIPRQFVAVLDIPWPGPRSHLLTQTSHLTVPFPFLVDRKRYGTASTLGVLFHFIGRFLARLAVRNPTHPNQYFDGARLFVLPRCWQ